MTIRVSIGGRIFGQFSYKDQATKERAVQKAIERVWEWLGSDTNPWEYIKGALNGKRSGTNLGWCLPSGSM
ncbi:MAG TPA: hypothetical protein VGF75_02060 [Candidatus Saccharimonadales bacterium]|jgi:hypothetical protein